jgi:hypothetical protein
MRTHGCPTWGGTGQSERTGLGVVDHGDLAGGLPVVVVWLDEGDDGADDAAGEDGHQVASQHGVVSACSAQPALQSQPLT